MALYHLSHKTAAKGKGRSAGAHARYIEREGKYEKMRSAEALEFKVSGNMPEWASTDPNIFWDSSDIYERANGRVYTELEIALPRELNKSERQELVESFIEKELKDHPYTAVIHNKKALDGGDQPHAHIMFTERKLDGIDRSKELFFRRANDKDPTLGGAKKDRDWNRREKIDEVRLSWEKSANRALEKAGHEARIDRRSLEAQGINREPEPKMGPERTQMLKRGASTEISDQVIELRHYRTEEKEVRRLETELEERRGRVLEFGEGGQKEQQILPNFSQKGESRTVSEEEKKKYRRTIDLVFNRLEKEDGTAEYRFKRSGRVAFTDHGDRIDFNNTSEASIKSGLQLAKEKGWKEVHANGNLDFRRESWLQGELMGVSVVGYDATKGDREILEARKEELARKKSQYQGKEKPPKESPRASPEQERPATKDPRAVEIKASEIEREVRREHIPKMESEQRSRMEELRSLGYQGNPDDLIYIHGIQERWTALPDDQSLKEKSFESLGAKKYLDKKEAHKRSLGEISILEKRLDKLAEKEQASILLRVSPKHLREKRAASQELIREKQNRDSIKSSIEDDRQRFEFGDKKDAFNRSFEKLKEERDSIQAKRAAVERAHNVGTKELKEAYKLREDLSKLGDQEVRIIREKGRVPTVDDQRRFQRQVVEAQEKNRKLSRGLSRGRR